jgi:hypothetical protein
MDTGYYLYFEDDCFANPAGPEAAEIRRACIGQLSDRQLKEMRSSGCELLDRLAGLLYASGVRLGQLVFVSGDHFSTTLAQAHGLSVRKAPVEFGREVMGYFSKRQSLCEQMTTEHLAFIKDRIARALFARMLVNKLGSEGIAEVVSVKMALDESDSDGYFEKGAKVIAQKWVFVNAIIGSNNSDETREAKLKVQVSWTFSLVQRKPVVEGMRVLSIREARG